ncbi:MAG: carboxypeptidase regulatory-like domain-containing protein [Candidatus Cloacimonetes bacterium]|nr:carboxypeptidase regulatory-like domain-containing protein [Candidatus Cloacimonadota bacterium]
MNKILIIIFTFLLFIIACEKNPNEAPYTHNANVEGILQFENGTPDTIQAKVKILNQNYALVIDETTTDETGFFQFTDLPPTSYQFSFSANGFEDLYLSNIILEDNTTTIVPAAEIQQIKPIEFLQVVVDGTIDENWEPIYENTHESGWSSSNDFHYLYLSRDDNNLYFALDVTHESQNSMNFYLDIDYGNGTGINDLANVDGGIADGRLTKNVTCPDSFGADIGLCVFGEDNSAIIVDFADVDYDLTASIQINSNIIEVSIPFSALYDTGIYPPNGKIAIVALIGGGDANSMANDTIPQQNDNFGSEGNRSFSSVFTRQY